MVQFPLVMPFILNNIRLSDKSLPFDLIIGDRNSNVLKKKATSILQASFFTHIPIFRLLTVVFEGVERKTLKC